jgi:hypothetical protein
MLASCGPKSAEVSQNTSKDQACVRALFCYVLLVPLSRVLPHLDLCVTVVTGTLCFIHLKVIINLLQCSSPGVPWGVEQII